MESIYYVMTWLCHRTCVHCYEERFHPYYGEELEEVVAQSRRNFSQIINHFPESMTYRDPYANSGPAERTGSVILAGGEILLESVRKTVLYPALDMLHRKYQNRGGAKLIVQTTGDTLTEGMLRELKDHHIWMVSISGVDEFHKGLEQQDARDRLQQRLRRLFDSQGFHYLPLPGDRAQTPAGGEPFYHFFGAQPDSWIGKLWPRGRAMENELSTADLAENLCNRWSGGLNFLDYHHAGSEVSVDPEGNVFPCCIKTRKPVGNLLERPLEEILDRLAGNPVYEAISMGHPERMGITRGWNVEKFLEKCRTTLPSGRPYQNLCIGCDRFHEEVLMAGEGLVTIGSETTAP